MNRLKIINLIVVSLITSTGYCQQLSYESELQKRLNPVIDTLTTKEIALFTAIATDVPEHSIRIVEENSHLFIEVRILEKNLAKEYYSIGKKIDFFKTIEFTKTISNAFMNKVVKAFYKAIDLHSKTNKSASYQDANGDVHLRLYDGPIYAFTVKDNNIWSSAKIEYDLDPTDFRYTVAITNLQLINDLKNGTFSESKYEIYK
jgi:hypothetical protein